MNNERSVDKLARYTMYAVVAAIILALCWYFRNVLVYIILSAVVALIGRPIMKVFKKVRIKSWRLPDWLSAMLTLILILVIFFGIITQIFPVIYSIVQNISANLQTASVTGGEINAIFDRFNQWLAGIVPNLDPNFKIQVAAVDWIMQAFDPNLLPSSITNVVGSVASAIGAFGIGLFSVVFISFFFIKDEGLFRRMVGSVVPNRIEGEAIQAIGDIEHLLSRYFVGLLTEVLGVTLLNFLGLWLIARMGITPAIGIAFMAGLLNVIPYVGPWIGGAIGVILGVVLKYSSAVVIGIYPNFWVVFITLVGVFAVTQLIDNYLFQPLIYSASIKSSPLEIFIVLLIAGHIGGIWGMLIAIPAYTVLRVIAARFFGDFKPIRRLIGRDEGTHRKPGRT